MSVTKSSTHTCGLHSSHTWAKYRKYIMYVDKWSSAMCEYLDKPIERQTERDTENRMLEQ